MVGTEVCVYVVRRISWVYRDIKEDVTYGTLSVGCHHKFERFSLAESCQYIHACLLGWYEAPVAF